MNGVARENPDQPPDPGSIRKRRGCAHTTARNIRECLGAGRLPDIQRDGPPRRRVIGISTRNVSGKWTVYFWCPRRIGRGDWGKLVR